MPYEFMKHTADVKIRASGRTIEEAFVSAAAALKETMCGDEQVAALIIKTIELGGKDLESLLYGFIEEFLYFFDSEGFLPAEVRSIEIIDGRLSALVAGDTAHRGKVSNSVKAVTYSEMSVTPGADGWTAEFVLDV